MFHDHRFSTISSIIAEARPGIQADGGDIELVAIDGDRVRVRLTGQCLTCALAGHTLGRIRRQIMAALGTPMMVVPVVDD